MGVNAQFAGLEYQAVYIAFCCVVVWPIIPGIGFLYGGLSRRKSALALLFQSFMVSATITFHSGASPWLTRRRLGHSLVTWPTLASGVSWLARRLAVPPFRIFFSAFTSCSSGKSHYFCGWKRPHN